MISRLDSYIPSTSLHSQEFRGSYAATYIDTEATAKASRQNPGLSGYPMLTPLSPRDSQTLNGSYAYIDTSEQDPDFFTQSVSANSYLNLGTMSPQTPSPIHPYQPVSVVHEADLCLYPRLWSDEVSMPIECGFDFNVNDVLPQTWAAPHVTTEISIAQTPWGLSDFLDASQQTLVEPVSHAAGIASPFQYQFRDTSSPYHPDWTFYEHVVPDLNVATSATSIHDFNFATSRPPICEASLIS